MNTVDNSITFVCTANMCRSPIAEFIFRREAAGWLAELGFAVEVISRGTHALPGDNRCVVASQRFEISDPGVSDLFRGEDPLTQGLVLTMEQMHMAHLVKSFPKLRTRIYTLPQAVEILEKIYDGVVDGSLFVSPDPEQPVSFFAPPLPDAIDARWNWLMNELDANRGLIAKTNSILTSGDFDIGDAHVPDGPTHELSLDLIEENVVSLSALLQKILNFRTVSELSVS
ncbi:MAG: hypothetical protein EBS36_02630 [Actinobacteria bacterium]|nr:hypothetical protein [Actinomycetota bacterium]NBY14883.1 hypothetical protein [Actinomycetota bacterium]